MTWSTIPVATGGRKYDGGVSFGIYKAGDRGVIAVIRLHEDVLGPLRWSRDERVLIRLGAGEHAGKVRLERCAADHPEGRMLCQQGKRDSNILALKVPPWSGLVVAKHASTYCAHALLDHGIEFEIPLWARKPGPLMADRPRASTAPMQRSM